MCIYIFPMPWVLSQWELVRHILLRIPAKIMNAAAKTALPFYLVMSIFFNKCCLLSCGLFFCHLLCVLANRIDITRIKSMQVIILGLLQRKKKEMHQAVSESARFSCDVIISNSVVSEKVLWQNEGHYEKHYSWDNRPNILWSTSGRR